MDEVRVRSGLATLRQMGDYSRITGGAGPSSFAPLREQPDMKRNANRQEPETLILKKINLVSCFPGLVTFEPVTHIPRGKRLFPPDLHVLARLAGHQSAVRSGLTAVI